MVAHYSNETCAGMQEVLISMLRCDSIFVSLIMDNFPVL
jgi:hypothetical protein